MQGIITEHRDERERERGREREVIYIGSSHNT